MSSLFRDYHDTGSLVSQMRSSREEDWGFPGYQQRAPSRRRPRVIVRRRRVVEES